MKSGGTFRTSKVKPHSSYILQITFTNSRHVMWHNFLSYWTKLVPMAPFIMIYLWESHIGGSWGILCCSFNKFVILLPLYIKFLNGWSFDKKIIQSKWNFMKLSCRQIPIAIPFYDLRKVSKSPNLSNYTFGLSLRFLWQKHRHH